MRFHGWRALPVSFFISLTMLSQVRAESQAQPQSQMTPSMKAFAEALAAEKKSDFATAEKIYNDLIQQKGNLLEYATYNLAEIYFKQKKYHEARNLFDRVLQLSPNIRMQQDCEFKLSQIGIEEKNYSKAKSYLVKLEKRNRHESFYPEILYSLAKVEKATHNNSGFCKDVRKLYAKYPEYELINKWGLVLSENLFEEQKTRCSANSEDQRTRIKNLQWAGLSQKAKSEIDEIRKSGAMEEAEIERLEVFYNLHEGEVGQALGELKNHFEERKHNFSFLMTLGAAAARAGEMQMAVGSYYQAYRIGGRSKLARQALFQSAFMSYQFQDYDGAFRRFQEFIKVFPTSGLAQDARWHLAWIRYLKADYNGALKSFAELRRAPSRRRKNTMSQDRITYWSAMSLFRQKKYDEARAGFEVLAKDQLLGYYSIAAQHRLKQLDILIPKPLKRGAVEATRRLSRFSSLENLMPSEEAGYTPASESTESEETMLLPQVAAEGDVQSEQEETISEDLAGGDRANDGATANDEESETKTSFSNPVLVKRFERARDLMILGLNDWAKWDLYDIERKTSNREYLKNLMGEYEIVENFHRSAYIGQVTFGGQRAKYGIDGVRNLWEHTYPKAYSAQVQKFSKNFDVPQELVWGIMRAESQYKRDVVSPVGALGLMQVMPGTAMRIAQIIGDKNFKAENLLEPEGAVKIGSRYLARLMKKFESNVALVAAGYNAGPHRVRSWLASFGGLDMDEFVEHIPFIETRNYVKKVISNFYVYNKLYNSKKDLLPSLAEANKVRVTEPIATKETWEEN